MLSCAYIIVIYIIDNSKSVKYFIENGTISVHLFQQNLQLVFKENHFHLHVFLKALLFH